MRTAKMIHMTMQHQRADAVGQAAHAHVVAADVDRGLHDAAEDEDPGQHHEEQVGMLGHPGQDGQHVEQHRQLELVARTNTRPAAPRFGQFGSRSAMSRRCTSPRANAMFAPDRHPHQQHEGQRDLDEERNENVLDGHGGDPAGVVSVASP